MFLLQRVFQWGLAQVLAKFLRENYHPKLYNFGRSYFVAALLAKIDIQSRHNNLCVPIRARVSILDPVFLRPDPKGRSKQ